jgi:hypothetical protein
MKRLTLAFAATLALAGPAAVFAGDQDFTLVNKTGLEIAEFYVSASNVNDWEEDVLGVGTLADGDKVTIKFSRDASACVFDLKIVDEDGDSVVWKGINLCKAHEITLMYQNKKPTALIK